MRTSSTFEHGIKAEYRTQLVAVGPGLYIEGVWVKVVVCKTGWVGEGWYYMSKQHSIVKTGNFNANFKLLTHNRYSVLNGLFDRQIFYLNKSVSSE